MKKLWNKLWEKLVNYETVSYFIFGVLTTLVDWVSYGVFTRLWEMDYRMATAGSWAAAVLFAFVTNKLYVFGSKSFKGKAVVWEVVNFFLARIFTGILDMALMWLLVDFGDMEGLYAKIIANVVVIVVNYLESKFWVFKKKSS